MASVPSGLTIEAVQREVAAYFDVKLHDLKGPKRHRAVAHPRMIAMYLARKLTNMSYPEIGSRFGGKDHSTVISAVRKIERLCGEDPSVRSVVGTLEEPSAPALILCTALWRGLWRNPRTAARRRPPPSDRISIPHQFTAPTTTLTDGDSTPSTYPTGPTATSSS